MKAEKLMHWLIVRTVARGLRGGIDDGMMLAMLLRRFPHRDVAWRWEIIGDAHIRNGQRKVRDDYRAWRKTGA